MDQPIAEQNQSIMDSVNQISNTAVTATAVVPVTAADLTVTRISKCPKSFSIESIISTNDKKSTDIESRVSPNYDKVTNSGAYFPSNVSMAAAASLYNPWFHNYFMQQHKVAAGNVLEMMQMNTANSTTIKEKFSEIFAQNSLAAAAAAAVAAENRPFLSASSGHLDRNAPPTASRTIEQYFGGVGIAENVHDNHRHSELSPPNSDYYKHLSSFGIQCFNQTGDNLEQCTNQLVNSNGSGFGGDGVGGGGDDDKLISDYDRSVRNDDSGADENADDDMDSDCNSEISLNMSPDGDHNTQGIAKTFIVPPRIDSLLQTYVSFQSIGSLFSAVSYKCLGKLK